MNVLPVIAWVLLAAVSLAMLVWLAIAGRIWLMMRTRPTVRHGLTLPPPEGGWPRLSIVVPAHNEERVIDACAASLRRLDYPDYELIFVLDRCTDKTASILAAHASEDDRIVVIENDACPEDWAGKCNAARLGAARATGDWMLFTDADTTFDADLARAATACAIEGDISLFSLLTTLTCETWFEWVAQPVASMSLGMLYPISRVNNPRDGRPFANGQFLLFRRQAYEEMGGHEAIKDALLEDLAAARLIYQKGGRVGLRLADGMLRVSMYGNFAAFRAGWQRIFIEACRRKPTRLRKHAWRLLALGVLAPLLQVAGLGVAAWLRGSNPALALALGSVVGVGWLAQTHALLSIYPMGGVSRSAIPTYPWGCWVVSRIFFRAASDLAAGRPIRWGGREYVLDARARDDTSWIP